MAEVIWKGHWKRGIIVLTIGGEDDYIQAWGQELNYEDDYIVTTSIATMEET